MRAARALVIFALILAAATPVASQDARFGALLIMGFAKNLEWPGADDAPFIITVLGDDPVYEELKELASAAMVGGRTVVVNKAQRVESIARTQILYISPERSNQLGMIASKFGPEHTLVVARKPGLAKEGAAINLTTIDGKLSFEINSEGLRKAGLAAKPLLFKLGKLVG